VIHLRHLLAKQLSHPLASVVLKHNAARVSNDEMLVKYSGDLLTLVIVKPVSKEYQALRRVIQGSSNRTTKHHEFVMQGIKEVTTCVTPLLHLT
jgi:hypothetical protein